MPTTPAARKSAPGRRTAPNTPTSDNVDFKQSGSPQPNNVQDRIRQWQTQATMVLDDPDAASVRSQSRSELRTNSDLQRPESPDDKEGEAVQIHPNTDPRGRSAGRWADMDQREWVRKGRATTPRKRLISDEHWKTKSPVKQGQPVEVKEKKPIEKAFLETILPNQDVDRTITKARAEREERRRRRTEARSKRPSRVVENNVNEGRHGDARVRPMSTPAQRSPSEKFERSPDLYVKISPSGHNASSPNYQQEPYQESFYDRSGSIRLDEGEDEEQRFRQRSKYAESLGQPPEYGQANPLKSRKGSILEKTKGIFGKSDPPRVASGQIPTIEAWLDEQADPFAEEIVSVRVAEAPVEVEMPKPIKSRSTRRKISIGSPPADPNSIWDAIGGPTIASSQRSRQREPIAAQADIDVRESSPGTLQRRGARPTKPKRRTTSEVPVQANDEDSVLSQNRTTSRSARHSPERANLQAAKSRWPAIVPEEPSVPDSLLTQDADVIGTGDNNLKRKLTTHEHLMTELSRPRSSRSIRKARSIKVMDRRAGEDVIQKIFESMREEETKYSRELRTLVDGVIPVLLQSVLSKTNSVAAAALFTTNVNAKDEINFARPIVDMGIALQRLKSLHNRIPLHNADSFLSWCQTAHKAYCDYVKAWRLGFQDIIVNLAPLEGETEDNNDIMGRDKNGDVVDTDGEKVDVAFLLKRPLVRIRKLGKDLCCLSAGLQDHPVAAKIADDYVELTAEAKRKHSSEQGRLEDEAASNIDATRVRDISTMAPRIGVTVDKSRKVRARDCFDMTLHHSTGQRMDCRVELVLRDNEPGQAPGGDVLICGIEEEGKFLLFAPVDVGFISARKNGSELDLVVMIRGRNGLRSEWRELFELKAEVPEAAAEWFNMLGSKPVPPGLNRVPTFLEPKTSEKPTLHEQVTAPLESVVSKAPSIEQLDIPIGEPSLVGPILPRQALPKVVRKPVPVEKPKTKLSLGGGLQQKPIPEHWHAQQNLALPHKSTASSTSSYVYSPDTSTVSGASAYSQSSSVREYRSTQRHSHLPSSRNAEQGKALFANPFPDQLHSPVTQSAPTTPRLHQNERSFGEPASVQSAHSGTQKTQGPEPLIPQSPLAIRPHHRRAASSIPSQDAHGIAKPGDLKSTDSAFSIPLTDSIRDTWSSFAGRIKRPDASSATPPKRPVSEPVSIFAENESMLPKRDRQHDSAAAKETAKTEYSPHPPRADSKAILSPRSSNVPPSPPIDLPATKVSKPDGKLSSSPLKHEYAPSTASETAEDYDSEYSDESISETSEDLESELKDEAKSLPDMNFGKRRISRQPTQQQSAPTAGTRTSTLAPSDSASQGPYRHAPPAAAYPTERKKRAMALVCYWSDTAMWQPYQEEECSIVVAPGLVEVFPPSSMQATGSELADERPLVAFELTPIVQLRQGTAVDITIRSPPTANSRMRNSNNTMFRSRTVIDSNELYSMIHWARCNNPTYMELERSRPQPQPAVTFSNRQSERPKSWFSFAGPQRRNSYRAGSMPPPSIQDSIASSGTVSNAISALKKLSKGSAFSISRSTVVRRPGRGTTQSLYSSGGETNTASGSGSSTPVPATQIGHVPGKEGPSVPETSAAAVEGAGMINNMKIEFYSRVNHDWRPMGTARLSVLPAPIIPPVSGSILETTPPGTASGTASPLRRDSAIKLGQPVPPSRRYRLPSSSHTPHRIHGDGREKRIVITKNKQPATVFLDVVLGESCFEKIAERGIAMNVWKEAEKIGERGGVMVGKGMMYMMKFDSSSEAGWVFGLCGTYRYRYGEGM